MKVIVKTSTLTAQLPKEIRYALIAGSDGLPESFELEVQVAPEKELYKLEKDFPKVRKALTNKEFDIFRLIKMNKNGEQSTVLHRLVASDGTRYLSEAHSHSNLIAVHVKCIRNKFRENNLPFEIETLRGSRGYPGRYKLIEL